MHEYTYDEIFNKNGQYIANLVFTAGNTEYEKTIEYNKQRKIKYRIYNMSKISNDKLDKRKLLCEKNGPGEFILKVFSELGVMILCSWDCGCTTFDSNNNFEFFGCFLMDE